MSRLFSLVYDRPTKSTEDGCLAEWRSEHHPAAGFDVGGIRRQSIRGAVQVAR